MEKVAYDFVPNQEYSTCVEVGGQHRDQNSCEDCITDYTLFDQKIPSMCPTDTTALKQSCADYCSKEATKSVGLEGQCYTGYYYHYTPTPGPNPATSPPEYCQEVCLSKCEANCPDFIGRRNKVQSCKFDLCPGSLPDYKGSLTTDVVTQQRLALYKPITSGEFPEFAMNPPSPCHFFNEQTNEWDYTMTSAPQLPNAAASTSTIPPPSSSNQNTNTQPPLPVVNPSSSNQNTNTQPPLPVVNPSSSNQNTNTQPPLPVVNPSSSNQNPPLPVNPSSSTPPPSIEVTETKKNNISVTKSDWLLILYIALGVIGLFLIGLVLYYHVKKSKPSIPKPSTPKPSTPKPSTPSTPKSKIITNTKTIKK